MSKATINNADTGLVARTAINSNFTELYGLVPASSSDGLTYVTRNAVAKPYFIWPGYVVGQTYPPDFGVSQGTGTNLGTTTAYFTVIAISEKVTISNLLVSVTAAGSNMQISLYASDATTKKPTGNSIGGTASFAVSSIANVNPALIAPVTLDPGLYWACIQVDAVVTINACVATQPWIINYVGISSANVGMATNAVSGRFCLTLASTFGTVPTGVTPASLTEQISAQRAYVVGYTVSGVF